MQGSQAPNQLQSREIILFLRNVLSLKVSTVTANENIFVLKFLLQLKLLYLELAIFSYDLFRFSDIRTSFELVFLTFLRSTSFAVGETDQVNACPREIFFLEEIIFDAVTV